MKLHFTSGYHPKGNGHTECVNQTLEQYLHIFTNYQQDNWSSLLPLAEFSYNNALNATTGVSPFFANKGYDLSITIHPEYELASSCAHQFPNFMKNSGKLSFHLKNNINVLQTRIGFLLQTSKLVTKFTLKPSSSALPVWQRNSLKISWPLWDYYSGRTFIVDSPTTWLHAHNPSCLSCFHARAQYSEHYSRSYSTSSSTSPCWRWTRSWNLGNSWL